MTWEPATAFAASHDYPPLQAPGDNHPRAYGPLQQAARFMTDGRYTIAVRSTARRSDGWSYNVVTCRESAWWFSYFHNARTGKRVRYSGTAPASSVERSWGLEQVWRDVAPL